MAILFHIRRKSIIQFVHIVFFAFKNKTNNSTTYAAIKIDFCLLFFFGYIKYTKSAFTCGTENKYLEINQMEGETECKQKVLIN